MDELTLDNKKYLSSKKAAQMTGYAKDYVGQLCREGRVDARLVGRNWYVLESSILEHRFGAPEEAEDKGKRGEEGPSQSWETARYAPEPVVMLHESMARPEPAPIPAAEPAETQKVLADMQSAWKEWFDREESKHRESVAVQEEALPDPTTEEGTAAAVYEDQGEEGIVPVHIERVSLPEPPPEVVYAEETIPVTLHRKSRERVIETPLMARKQLPTHGRRTIRSFRSTYRAVFLAVAGLAIVVALIGSGLADDFVLKNGSISPVTNFVGGISQINK